LESAVTLKVVGGINVTGFWQMGLTETGIQGLSLITHMDARYYQDGETVKVEIRGQLSNAEAIFGRTYHLKYQQIGGPEGIVEMMIPQYTGAGSTEPDASKFTASMIWNAPFQDGMAVRKVGEPSNVKIKVSGMVPNSVFELINKNVNGTIIARSGAMGTGSNGLWEQFVTAPVNAVYHPGDYTAHIVHQGISKLASRFRILADVVDVPPPSDTGDPPPVGGGGDNGGGNGGVTPSCPSEPVCSAGQKARAIPAGGLIGGVTGACEVESWVCEDICVDPLTEWDPVSGKCVSIVDGGGTPPGDDGGDTTPPGGNGDDGGTDPGGTDPGTPEPPVTPSEGSNLWLIILAGVLLLWASK